MNTLTDFIDSHTGRALALGIIVMATVMCWETKISGDVWWGAVSTTLTALLAKEGVVQVKNISAGNAP